jgi:hypothetical protein
MEDVATTGDLRQGLSLAGPQPTGEIGDGAVGAEAAVSQLQQTHAPGQGVAVLLESEQVAVGRGDVGPDQDGAAGLEGLVVGADADTGEVLLAVDLACGSDSLMQDVMDSADRQGMVEEILQQLTDTTDGAVADEGEAEDQLTKPGLGDGQPVQQCRRIGRGWGEGVLEGAFGLVELLVDELATDVLVGGDVGDGDASKSVKGQLLAGWPRQGGGATGMGLVWG